jgi:hypothetical protein
MRTSMLLKVPAGLIAAVLTVASWAPLTQAQDSGFAVRMKVPFAFQTASGQHFAAGAYTIQREGQFMLIQGAGVSGLALIRVTNDSLPATKGKAVFTQYGDQYFLRGVWVAGKASHLLCNTPKVERRSLIAVGETSTAVEVALLREGR